MPSYWTKISSSPPIQRRNEVAELCRQHDCRLVGNQIYYDNGGDFARCLIFVPEGKDPTALFNALEATEFKAYVDADEKEAGKRPPGRP